MRQLADDLIVFLEDGDSVYLGWLKIYDAIVLFLSYRDLDLVVCE